MQTFSERFRESFPPETTALLVADFASWNLAGRECYGELRAANLPVARPCVFDAEPPLDAASLDKVLAALAAIPEPRAIVAVGGGRLADLAKLAASRKGCGYAVYVTCPDSDSLASPFLTDSVAALPLQPLAAPALAPRFTYADPARLLHAPLKARSAGYGDLFGKFTAGADWLLAAKINPVEDRLHEEAWALLQNDLADWTIHPKELSQSDPAATEDLLAGLLAAGASAARVNSKRPCEGAEHLFAQTWALSGCGDKIPHGHLVALGTLCSLAFYVTLFKYEFTPDFIQDALATYPSWETRKQMICSLLPESRLRTAILTESRAKHLESDELSDRLTNLSGVWNELRDQLSRQLMYFPRMRAMLLCADCPITPADIGYTPARLAASAIVAQMLSRRYTVLDLAYETGTFAACIASLQDAFAIDERAPNRPV